MRDLARQAIRDTAQIAGLDPVKVYEMVESDNLTIKRPYVTIQFLPEKLERTGRKLAAWQTKTEHLLKKEIYEVELMAALNILADNENWLAGFSYKFLANLPRGLNDSNGAWVKIRAAKATFSKPPEKRVGEKVIEVFKKCGELFEISFTGRITGEEVESLIQTYEIKTHWQGVR